MNPTNLKALVAAYHKKVAADLTVNAVDLFLVAANNAQKQAQRRHNFEFSRVSATLTIDGVNGGALSDAVIEGQVNETLTVSGTLSPAAGGTYTPHGTFGGLPFWVVEGATTYFLYYNAAATTYVLASILTTGALTNYWTSASALTPIGSLTAVGTNTGTVIVAYATLANWSGIREIVAIQRSTADGWRMPVDFSRPDIPMERDRTAAELTDFYDFRDRYPSDADRMNQRWNTSLVQRGDMIHIYPRPISVTESTFDVILEAYGTLPSITSLGTSSDPDPNFLWTHGADWLQWFIIHDLNFLFKTFVNRNEGNLASPTDMRDVSWNDLLAYDTYMIDSNTTRSR